MTTEAVQVELPDSLAKRLGVAQQQLESIRNSEVEEKKFQLVSELVDSLEALLQDAQEELGTEQTLSAGFAEMQLTYGKALLELLRNQKDAPSQNESMFGPNIPEMVPVGRDDGEDAEDQEQSDAEQDPTEDDSSSVEDGPNVGDSSNEQEKPETEGTCGADGEHTTPERDSENAPVETTEDEQDLFELTWEQLECARVAFEKLGETKLDRLAEVYEALGDFSIENDAFEQASQEYEAARTLYARLHGADSRIVVGLLHSKYLALRRVMPTQALHALKDAISVFESRILNSSDEKQKEEESKLVKDMKEEVVAYEKTLEELIKMNAEKQNADAGTTTVGFGKSLEAGESSASVVQVQPRKRVRPEDVVFPTFEKKQKISP
uniref:Tetratricopeptide SHNi-TPR domain-containing protein n=1 Tax=Timspurckia oligopyrenoides TaxID=708627 RepID=A0A7S0ZE46_9RHOD|mmetsp:Transcript_1583/g.2836  ORF Transcript_1583/g.2836 Transcript_1583/m.2836 type:complete len:380 (+) Transcript_1583:85-1224(+)|eukprot:CAMPEP_0182447276 /NCGR_PEP_ID=MMETSP1172-20130603/13838_1 /TAXON_ID=708627 /ORGANISM="Timspurckia oligopyrenoides, Strain CCMP3278" /LENGTH=379 /DNA_ID=CAMNT_0024643655 /DNA_START=50 /DNA_END=1189 /DNA_ORIENTATION=+